MDAHINFERKAPSHSEKFRLPAKLIIAGGKAVALYDYLGSDCRVALTAEDMLYVKSKRGGETSMYMTANGGHIDFCDGGFSGGFDVKTKFFAAKLTDHSAEVEVVFEMPDEDVRITLSITAD